MKTIFIALTGLLLTVGAARAQTATPTSISVDPRWGCDTVKDFPAPDLGEPQNIDNFKKQLVYYRCTAYEGEVAKVLAAAEKWVAARALQVSRPAVVLDIDETSLSNWATHPRGQFRLHRKPDARGDAGNEERYSVSARLRFFGT